MAPEFNAKTRGGDVAYFSRVQQCHIVRNACGDDPFVYLGFIRADQPELWTARGHWLETGSAHRHDLMLD